MAEQETEQEVFAPGEPIPPRGLGKREQIELIARLMDTQFRVPGTNIRIGFDALLGLVPVIGDTAGALISGYLVKLAHELGVPGHVKAQMAINIAIDWAIGLVPFAGDVLDIGWKANKRNAELVRRHL